MTDAIHASKHARAAAEPSRQQPVRDRSSPSSGDVGALDLQRHAGNQAVATLLSNDPGEPLDPSTRTDMESNLGAPLSDVRIHTSRAAAESARTLDAAAYAAGNHVVFDSAEYRPMEDAGRWVLAHELTHVLQQRHANRIASPDTVGRPHDAFEQNADRVATAAIAGGPASVLGAAGAPAVQCLKKTDLENRVREVVHKTKGDNKVVVAWLEHSKISNETHRLQVDNSDARASRAFESAIDRLRKLWPPSNWQGGLLAVALSHLCPECQKSLDEIKKKYNVETEMYVFQVSSTGGASGAVERSRSKLASGTLQKPPPPPPPVQKEPRRFEPTSTAREAQIEFELDPSAPAGEIGFTSVSPEKSPDWIERKLLAVQWEIVNGGFYLYCRGPSLPLFLPSAHTDWNLTNAQSIGGEIYGTKAEADAAVSAAGGNGGGVTRFAYFRVGQTGIIAPTIFSPATTPHLIDLMRELLQQISETMVQTMTVTAVSIIAGIVVRGVANVLGRLIENAPVPKQLRVPEETPPPVGPTRPPPQAPANENAIPPSEPKSNVVRMDEWLAQQKAGQQEVTQPQAVPQRKAAGAYEPHEPIVGSGGRGRGNRGNVSPPSRRRGPYIPEPVRAPRQHRTRQGETVNDPGFEGRRTDDPWRGMPRAGRAFAWTRRNVQEMLNGRPPWGTDGEKVVLHHRAQQKGGPLDELTAREHRELTKRLHGEDISQIDRELFDEQRARYWVARAREFLGVE